MLRIFLIVAAIVVAIPVVLFIVLLVHPRPTDNTPAWVFEGDSSNIDYCEFPVLDRRGLLAKDIPQGHTPGCGWVKFPQPILRDCTEPLPQLWDYPSFGTTRMKRICRLPESAYHREPYQG